MSTPISSVSGLASGLQWQDLVDQIMAAESARRIAPLQIRERALRSSIDAWHGYSSAIAKLTAAAASLRDGSAFDAVKLSGGISPTTGRTLFTAAAAPGAATGSYRVEVLSLAQSEKMGGAIRTSVSDPLGESGEFLINGRRIQIDASDSLTAIRDKINAANSGSAATHVTATILSTGTSASRLVLTSDATGASGIELVDGESGVLQSLGFVDGSLVANATADGGSRSHRFSSATMAIATLLGVTFPPPSVVKVGDKTISVDLATDTLASIAARINAVGGSASVVEETVNGTSYSRLSVGSRVSADGGDPGSLRTLEILGFVQGGRDAVAQSVRSSTILDDAASGGVATGSTLLTDLRSTGGGSLLANDTVSIRGMRGDGSTVSVDFSVAGNSTVDDLLTAINAAYGGGSRAATAAFSGGQFVLTDQQGGDSRLALSITSSGSGSLDFGRTETIAAGRAREITAGADSAVRVDGVLLTRESNTISDALAGVTLELRQAEAGTVVELSLSHDLDGMASSITAFASAYNDVLALVKKESSANGALPYNGSLRSSMATLTNAMLTDVAGLAGTSYGRAAIAGVALTKAGTLSVDASILRSALTTNLADVRRLFSTGGSASSGSLSYLLASDATRPGTYDVQITSVATTARAVGSVLAGGKYVDDGSADQLTITDGAGRNSSIELANGDTLDTIVSRLQQAFEANGLELVASNDGGALAITGKRYGSSESFTVAYTGGGSDSSAQLGVAAGSYSGTDVQGTIGGLAAVGLGQTLRGVDGTAVEGLVVSYSGAVTGNAGTVSYVLGTAGMIARATDAITRTGDGLVDSQVDVLERSDSYLQQRMDDIQRQLDQRQRALQAQFIAMEAAMSRIQSQQAWLTSQIAALPGFAGMSQRS